MKITVLIIFVALMLNSCSLKEKDNIIINNTESSEETETDTEDSKMSREFCVIDKINETQFVLKNTSDELYYIDNSYLGELNEGDTVLLVYKERDMISDGKYNADVYAIYHDDYKLVEPR